MIFRYRWNLHSNNIPVQKSHARTLKCVRTHTYTQAKLQQKIIFIFALSTLSYTKIKKCDFSFWSLSGFQKNAWRTWKMRKKVYNAWKIICFTKNKKSLVAQDKFHSDSLVSLVAVFFTRNEFSSLIYRETKTFFHWLSVKLSWSVKEKKIKMCKEEYFLYSSTFFHWFSTFFYFSSLIFHFFLLFFTDCLLFLTDFTTLSSLDKNSWSAFDFLGNDSAANELENYLFDKK